MTPEFPPPLQRLPSPYRDEQQVLAQLRQALAGAVDWAAVTALATPWVEAVRRNPPPFWAMESLLKEYPISSAEGLALMRLAEALLRVPDTETAIALTADQLGRADFEGSSDAALARLSSLAIGLSKRFLPGEGESGGLLGKLGARTVVAATLRAVQLLGKQFVLGQTIASAGQEAVSARKKMPRLNFSFDMLGEGARTARDAEHYLASYLDAIKSIAATADIQRAAALNDGISIKLSALYPRFEDSQRAQVLAELVPRVWGLCELAARANIGLTVDAEEVDRLELSLDVFEALAERVAAHFPAWQGFGLALQAYQTRCLELVEHVIGLARKHRLRLTCRLVKGAYWDFEVKRAQELGLAHYPVFTQKAHTDVAYLACARALLGAPDAIYPQFAGHNAASIAAVLNLATVHVSPHAPPLHGSLPPEGAGLAWGGPALRPVVSPHAPELNSPAPRFELQRLHGMGEGIFQQVLQDPGVRCRIYAPVGSHRDLLAYLVRRLLENGANSSFVHQLADETVPAQQLLASPLEAADRPLLALPSDLFGSQRRNSAGLDLSVPAERAPLLAALATCAVPQMAIFDAKYAAGPMNTCRSSYQKWSKTSVAERSRILRLAADQLQLRLPEFCALLVKEAFKTWGDAVAEVREAIDFLRYYAGEAERLMQPMALPTQGGITGETNVLTLRPRGVWLCISPWNFPLAIFVGQVAAALSTGNTVLAKPAEQTPGVALAAARLLVAAGVPEGALQLVHGPGPTVGAALVALPNLAGVVFTGSTATALHINRALAAKDGPITPLIAETGGINAMLVDSSALPEQVADAVVQSAFRSAGQRCSALRLLCVHEAIADKVIEMVQGAAELLQVGDPALLATDVGPVIDALAFERISRHIERLSLTSKVLLAQSIPAAAAMNSIAPCMFEIAQIADANQEIFGPVLQVVRYSGDAAGVIEQINALGYGLTLGIQTRIDSRALYLADHAHVGNIYINRGMTGAVVGVQAFGGEGLSGTGPKAGGPHYLLRFCAEQTLTINTTAAGGNAALMAL